MRIVERTSLIAKIVLGAGLCVMCHLGSARADFFKLSQMPDPRGEFIRLCAPFMVSRHSHPESVCDCLRTEIQKKITDPEMQDAMLFGITELGVPSISETWIPRTKRRLIGAAMSAVAEPTISCMFDAGEMPKLSRELQNDGGPNPRVGK
jgi:hypothetical protein